MIQNLIFTYLNNGDIRTQFRTRDNYIDFIKNNNYLNRNYIYICIPGVLTKNGLNILF